MALKRSGISWCDYAVSVVTGCSGGCPYCYARKMTERFPKSWPSGFKPTFHPERLADLAKAPEGSIVMVSPMGDLFDPAITNGQIDATLQAMAAAPGQFMVLTKQHDRLAMMIGADVLKDAQNIWMGATVTHQDSLEYALYMLSHMPTKTFVSFEPLLERLDIPPYYRHFRLLDYVIVGGMNPGPPLHEAHPDWLQAIVDECELARIPLHYKHVGKDKNPMFNGRRHAAMIDGREEG
jgi:protein gp37